MPELCSFPAPDTLNPVLLPNGTAHAGTVFLRAVINHPRITVGDYSYASAHVPPEDWAFRLAPYLYPLSPERLTIGKFCQIADGARFITSSANHRYDGFSSFPFAIFGGAGAGADRPSMPGSGPDTCVGHDVWIGSGATVLPGARIGAGCIIGAEAVVSGDVAPYSIVAGNPARVIRRRFEDGIVARLLALAWWDWPIERILAHEAEICGADIAALEAAA
jgi:virginiamycin A acetyltransferase